MGIQHICILGGGTAGWMTAAALSHKLQKSGISIGLVESEQIGTVGVGEATLPHIRYFNRALGINEAEFMKATNATFKLGIEFCDWGRVGDSYIHPFGDFGKPVRNIEFYHYWNRLRLSGHDVGLDEYSYAVMAAEHGKFHLPDSDTKKIESTFSYAYQFDSSLYADFLRAFAEHRGVKRTEGRVIEVQQDNATGHITRLKLDSGEYIAGDLFIDCSGFRGLLIEQKLSAGYEDWSEWLPCNRAIAVPCEASGKPLPYTRATARKVGWQWRIPLQHRTGNGYVYCSEFVSDDVARETLLGSLEGNILAEPNRLYFKTGRRKKFWDKNVVAVGLSAGFLEPLESTSIHLIQEGITALVELFPNGHANDLDMEEYNLRMELQFERVRDFLLLHYVATQRDDSDMWRYFRNMSLPDSLRSKIEAWLSRGLVPAYERGVFLPPSWIAVFTGQNLLPRGYDPRANLLSRSRISDMAHILRRTVRETISRAPDHSDFIRSYGAAIPELVSGSP
ncbi:MAG: tryptophan 7-halogenase [Hyphomonadaceae bacterium]|nr:tryptophan 7-halogenase [Hyphomonadaceae bacterium]